MKTKSNEKYLGYYEDNGEWRCISCPSLKKALKIHPTKWEDIERKIKSAPISGKRYSMHKRSNTDKFCFNPGQGATNNPSGNNETPTHEFVKEFIRKKEILNLIFQDNPTSIKPDSIWFEEKKVTVYCPVKKREVDYYPDIFIYFSNNKEMEEKWGGKLAIEIIVTHSPSNTKRKHFQYAGIPLLELVVPEEIWLNPKKDLTEDPSKIEKYIEFLSKYYENGIPVEIEFSTYYNPYIAKQWKFTRDNLSSSKLKVRELEKNYVELSSKTQQLIELIKTERLEMKGVKEENERFRKEVSLLHEKKIINRVKRAFKSN